MELSGDTPKKPGKSVSRRRFLQMTAGASLTITAGSVLAACGDATPTVPVTSTTTAATSVTTAAASATTAATSATTAAASATTAASAATTAAGSAATTAAAAVKSTGRLIAALTTYSATLDPHTNAAAVGLAVIFPIFDALTWNNFDGKLDPALATEWKAIDPNTWQFKLRQGVTFSNGEPFNADSVVFSLDRARNPDNKLAILTRVAGIASVEKLDDYTVNVKTKTPDPILPNTFGVVMMLPPKYFQEVGAAKFAEAPIGTGRFTVKEFQKDRNLLLTAWDKGWRGAPSLAELQFKFIKDPAVKVQALKSGEVDFIDTISPDATENLKSSGFKIIPVTQGSVSQYIFNVKEKPLDDKRVRQALNYAVDKETLVKELRLGYATVAQGQILGSDCLGFNPALKPYEYNPEKARQLLTEAGYKDGFTMTAMHLPSELGNKTVGEAIGSYLEKVGVKVQVDQKDTATWTDALIRGPRPPLLMAFLNYDPQYDARLAYTWLSNASSANTWANSDFQQLYDQASVEADRAKREKIYQKMGEVVREEAPSLFFWQNQAIYAASSKVEFKPGPGVVIRLDDAKKAS